VSEERSYSRVTVSYWRNASSESDRA
jgi:hypothetical protein